MCGVCVCVCVWGGGGGGGGGGGDHYSSKVPYFIPPRCVEGWEGGGGGGGGGGMYYNCMYTGVTDVGVVIHTHVHIHVHVAHGDYGFKLHFAEYGSTTPWTFSQALNTLFIKPGDDFAVTFKFAAPPPPGCYVRALVCYGDPVHIQKLGVVTMAPYRDKGSKGGGLQLLTFTNVHLYL